jgi:multidrug/hemolysin transport system permease protein
MRVVVGLTGRNLLLFARDPLGILLSLLSASIVFLLYTFFLGNLQFASIIERAPTAHPGQVHGFVDAWMFGGIVALSTMTSPLGALSVFLEDAASNRFRDFLVSPIKRGQLVLGYLVAAFVTGVLITLVVLVTGLLYLATVSGVTLGVAEVVRSVGWIILSTAGFTALWAFIVSFLRTSASFSAVSTIVGTGVGFLAGAYIAVGLLPESIRSLVSALPFAQSAMLLRSEFTEAAASSLAGDAPTAINELNDFYGITLSVGSWGVPSWCAIGFLALLAVVCTLLATARIRGRIG